MITENKYNVAKKFFNTINYIIFFFMISIIIVKNRNKYYQFKLIFIFDY